MVKPPRIALVGPYLLHNFGDDLIGATIVRKLSALLGPTEFLVPFLGKENCDWLGIDCCQSVLSAINWADLVLIGGGGVLGDTGVGKTHRYYFRHFRAAAYSRLLGKKVVITGVGAGPIHYRRNRLLAKMTCSMAETVGVRDEESKDFLIQTLKVPATKVNAGADLALLWTTLERDLAVNPNGSIGIQFDPTGHPEATQCSELPQITHLITEFVKRNRDRVVLITNGDYPSTLLQFFQQPIKQLRYRDLGSFLPELQNLRAIFTSHLHLSIAAYAAGLPCYSLCLKEKTLRFFRQIGHPERCIPIWSATAATASKLIDSLDRSDEWSDFDRDRLSELQSQADRLLHLVSHVITSAFRR